MLCATLTSIPSKGDVTLQSLSVTILWKADEQYRYFTVLLFVFQFYPILVLENLSTLDLAPLVVKELIKFMYSDEASQIYKINKQSQLLIILSW